MEQAAAVLASARAAVAGLTMEGAARKAAGVALAELEAVLRPVGVLLAYALGGFWLAAVLTRKRFAA